MAAFVRIPPKPSLAVDRKGTGPLVLFLHGVGGNRSNWSEQLPAFAPHFTAVAWDARGYGESDDPDGPSAFSDFADDVVRLLDHFDATTAHLVGLSMGGHIALDVAARYAGRVASLTLCDTNAGFAHLTEEQRQEFVRMRTQRLLEGGEPAEMAWPVAQTLAGRAATPATMQRLVDSMTALHKQSYIRTVEAMVTVDFSAGLGAIAVPTLVLVGADDRLTPPEMARDLQQRIPFSDLTVIPEAGHLSNIECPGAFNRAVLAFLLRQR